MLADDRRVGSVERLLHLKKAPLFGTLKPELLSVIADAARPRVHRKGALLLREGEHAPANHFLIEGRVHLEHGGQVVGHAEPGAAIGGLGIVARLPATVTASADTDALTLELDADTMLDLLEDHFGILRHFLREVTGRIIQGWQRLPTAPPPLRAGRRQAPIAARDLDLVERIFFLRRVVPFDRASINALAELARSLSEVHFEPGARLWNEGEAARHVILVVAGKADCSSRGGFDVEAGPGMPLGALEAIAGLPRWYDVDVSAPLTGLSSDIEVLFDVFEDNLEMALQFLTAMAQWLRQLSEQIAEQAPEQLGGLTGLDVSRLDSPEEPPIE